MRTEIQNSMQVGGANASISNRGISQPPKAGAEVFSQSLVTAAGRLANEKSEIHATSASTLVRTAPLLVDDSEERSSANSAQRVRESQAQGEGSSVIQTPFGVFARPVPGSAGRGNTPIYDQVRVYFKTHQPGEWMYDPKSRAAFAGLYGEKALVTLDWLGTVPENDDPMWQTHQAVDRNGIPIPQPIKLGGNT